MADLSKLAVTLTLDTTQFNQGITTATASTEKLGGTMASVFGGTMLAQAVTKLTGLIKGLAAETMATGSNFEASMSQVAATMGKTVKEMNKEIVTFADGTKGSLTDLAKAMGESTVFSANEAAQALNYMALAGYDAQTSAKMLPNVLNLAAAGNMELATASDMVTDAQTALGLSLEQTSVMVDQMAKTASISNTSVSQLGEAMLTIGGTAKFMSGGTTELNQVLGILADNGIKGSEAGTHLRNMLLKLSSPTDAGATALEKLGVSVYDSTGKMKPMVEIMTTLKKSLSNLTDEQQVQALSKIFNTRDIAAANALLDTNRDRWDELGLSIISSKNAAEQMSKTMLDNVKGDLTLFRSQVEGIMVKVFEKVAPVIRKAIKSISDTLKTIDWDRFGKKAGEALGKVVDFINKLIQNGRVVVGVIGAMITGFAANKVVSFATSIGKATASIVGLIAKTAAQTAATTAATAAQTGLNVAMAANPIGLVVTALTALVGGLALYKSTALDVEEVEHGMSESAQELVDKINERKESYDNLKQSIEQKAAGDLEEIANAQRLKDELEKLVDVNGNVKAGYEDRVAFILGQLNEATGLELQLIDGVIEGYQEQMGAIDELIEKKKAEILLQAAEEAYAEAIRNRADAEHEVVKAVQERYEKEQEVTALREELAAVEKQISEDLTGAYVFENKERKRTLEERLTEEEKALETLDRAYNDNETTLRGYYSDIASYEEAAALMLSGKTDEALACLEEQNNAWSKAADAVGESADEQRKILEQQVIDTALNAKLMEQRLKEGVDGMSEDMVAEAKETARAAEREFKEVGKGMMNSTAVGAESERGSLMAKVSSIFQSVINAAKAKLQQHSPSRVFRYDIGANTIKGYELGLKDGEGSLLKTVDSVTGNVIDEWNSQVGDMRMSAAIGFDDMDGASTNMIKYGGTTINVYANDSMDELTLANKVQSVIDNNINRRLEVWA